MRVRAWADKDGSFLVRTRVQDSGGRRIAAWSEKLQGDQELQELQNKKSESYPGTGVFREVREDRNRYLAVAPIAPAKG